jgi:hypothetical protein
LATIVPEYIAEITSFKNRNIVVRFFKIVSPFENLLGIKKKCKNCLFAV